MTIKEKLDKLKGFENKYSQKIQALFKKKFKLSSKINYQKDFNLSEEDIPELIILAQDLDIYNFEFKGISDKESCIFYGVIHAWHALSELKAKEAVDIFISRIECSYKEYLYDDYHIDEWILESFKKLIMPFDDNVTQGKLINAIKSEDSGEWLKTESIRILSDMVKQNSFDIDQMESLLIDIMKSSKNKQVNAYAIESCMELNLTQLYEDIKVCYEKELVDFDYIGDLEDVEISFKMKDKRSKPIQMSESMRKIKSMVDMLDFEYNKTSADDRTYYSSENNYIPHTREARKIGRNEPCLCGSGKKYKKCCIHR
jgi:hypothetical protein